MSLAQNLLSLGYFPISPKMLSKCVGSVNQEELILGLQHRGEGRKYLTASVLARIGN